MPLVSWFERNRQVSRTTAWICLLINLLVTPGLGSLVAGRLWSGVIELVIAFTGFGFVMAWFFHLFRLVANAEDLTAGLRSRAWLVILGLTLFGLAWLLSLITSILVIRALGRHRHPSATAAHALNSGWPHTLPGRHGFSKEQDACLG